MSASVHTMPPAMQLQDISRQLDEAEEALRGVRFAVLRCQRLRDRLRYLVTDVRLALEQGRHSILRPHHLETLRNTADATKQLFGMLSRISIFDYFVRNKVWNSDITQLSRNVVVCRRETGLLTGLQSFEDEDIKDGRLDEEVLRSKIRQVGGVKESLKREAMNVDPRDANALCGVFARIRESPRGRGMGFEATFLRNSEQILRARAGLSTPLSPPASTPPSPYLSAAPRGPSSYNPPSPVNIPQRRASVSRPTNLSSSDPNRPNGGQPASFFMPNPYRTGPSEMSRPMNTPPSASRSSFSEARTFRQGLFGARNSMEDDIIRRAASVSLGGRNAPVPPQPIDLSSQRPSRPPTPGQRTPGTTQSSPAAMREPPARRGSGRETILTWEDPRTRREIVWRPFEPYQYWQEPGWLTRVEAVDQGTVSVGTRVQVVSDWRATSGPLAKAIEEKRVPPSRLRRLHVGIGSPVVALGIFKLRDELYLAAYSLHRLDEGGICAYGLLPVSSVSVSGRKPAMQPQVVDAPLHESAFGFNAHARSYSGLVPIEGVVLGDPSPAIHMRRTDEESSPLNGPSTAVMSSNLQRVTGARKRAEVREVRDNFGAVQRQNVWIFEYKVQQDLGADTKELLFFDESLADAVIFAVKRVCRGLNIVGC